MSVEATKNSETFIQSKKGNRLYCRYWNEDATEEPKETKRGLVFVAHGLAEHCLFYSELAQFLINNGFYVFSHDHVGHGQSEGDRVHIAEFSDYVEDMLEHIDHVRGRHEDLPVFLIGHSMGGTMAILAAMARPQLFKGVVLIAPLVMMDKKVASPVTVFLAKMLAKVAPQMHVAKIDSKAISRDPEHVKRYEDDPLNYHKGIKCGTAMAAQSSLDKILANLDQIEWPFYVLHGDEDALCDLEGSKLLYEKAISKDKQIKIFPEAFHQLHHELPHVKKETLETIAVWLKERS